jgi:aspartate/methionine/tyrosine aminotransferase
MNELAVGLNNVLDGTVVGRALSDFGRRMYFPRGVVAQTAEASQHAHRFDATVGIAATDGEPLFLPSLARLVPGLSPTQAFAYAPTAGLVELRARWQQEIRRKNPSLGAAVASSLPLVTSGLTHAITLVADLFVGRGDTVLLPDMFWGNYRLIVSERCQATLQTFPLFRANADSDNSSAQLDLAALDQALIEQPAGGKVTVLLNFPNNPTGYSPLRAETDALCATLRRHAERGVTLVVVCDDAYTGLFYTADVFSESLFAQLAGAHANLLAIKVDGATKENYAWGFRLGFLTFAAPGLEAAYPALEQKVMGAVRSSVSSSSRLAQSLMLQAMQTEEFEHERAANFRSMAERFEAVRETLQGRVAEVLRPLPFNSGYFLTLYVTAGRAEVLRQTLLHQRGIGTISIDDHHLRVAYSTIKPTDMRALFDEIYRVASELSGTSSSSRRGSRRAS